MHRCTHVGVLLLTSQLLLLACNSPGPVIDPRTGKPMMAGPWE
ncbi:hypothetical protein FUT69_11440, partial [Xylella taiwanensis]